MLMKDVPRLRRRATVVAQHADSLAFAAAHP